jgi:SAM-dependent methyltransferase
MTRTNDQHSFGPTPYDLGYFKPSQIRRDIPIRSIRNRLEAWNLDERYYDGDRQNGYGGFNDDGRWVPLVQKLKKDFSIQDSDDILDLGCKKGFMLRAFKGIGHVGKLFGIENHQYPLVYAQQIAGVTASLGPYYDLQFDDDSLHFLMGFSSIYMQNLGEVVRTLREIQRVSKGRAHVTLGAFDDDESKKKFESWTLIGTTHLHVEDWMEVMDYTGYKGTYFFTTPKVLGF